MGVVQSERYGACDDAAGESSAEQVEVRHETGVNLSCVWIVNLLLSGVMDGAVSGMGVFVDLTVPNTLEAARPGESRAEPTNAGKHIKVTNQVIDHLLFKFSGDEKSTSPIMADALKMRCLFRQTGIGFIEAFANTPYLQGVHHTHISGDHNDP